MCSAPWAPRTWQPEPLGSGAAPRQWGPRATWCRVASVPGHQGRLRMRPTDSQASTPGGPSRLLQARLVAVASISMVWTAPESPISPSGRFWTASTSAGDTPIEQAPNPATETLALALDSSPVALGGGSAQGWARAPCGPTLAYCMHGHRPARRPRKRLSRLRRGLLGETEPNGSDTLDKFGIRELSHRCRQQVGAPLTLDEWSALLHAL